MSRDRERKRRMQRPFTQMSRDEASTAVRPELRAHTADAARGVLLPSLQPASRADQLPLGEAVASAIFATLLKRRNPKSTHF
jgi:hypothetical protein